MASSRSRTPPRRLVSMDGMADLEALLKPETSRPTEGRATSRPTEGRANTATKTRDKETTATEGNHAQSTTEECHVETTTTNFYAPNRIRINDIRKAEGSHLKEPAAFFE